MADVAPAPHEALAIREKAAPAAVTEKVAAETAAEYGKPMRELFLIDPSFRNLNHGVVKPQLNFLCGVTAMILTPETT